MSLKLDDERSEPIEGRLFMLAIVAIGVLLMALAWPLLRGELYVTGDLGRAHLPLRYFYHQALAAGHSFLWFPYEFSGFYVHGEGQLSFSHPLNRLSYGWLPFQPAFALEFMRSWVVLAVGMYLLLRRWQLGCAGAAFGALVFTFGSFNMMHFTHLNFTGVVSHLPWILLCTDIALRESDRKKVALARLGISLLTASQLLHTHPQMVFMSLAVQALFILDWLYRARQLESFEPWRAAARALLPLVGAICIGFIMAGAQLLPLWDGLNASTKSEASSSFSNSLALAPINLGQLVAPYLFQGRTIGPNTSGLAFYVGAALPPLIAWLLIAREQTGEAWPRARWALMLAMIGFVLALGEWGQLYRLQQMLPVVGLFRAPGRYILICELGLTVAGAIAFASLLRSPRVAAPVGWRWLWPVAFPAIASIGLSVAVLAGIREDWVPGDLAGVMAGPALILVATALVLLAARGYRIALAALIVFTAADLGFYGLSHVGEVTTKSVDEWRSSKERTPLASEQRNNLGPPVLTTHGVRLAGGYISLFPARTLPVGIAAARISSYDPGVIENSLRVASVKKAFGREVKGVQPRVRMLSEVLITDDVLARIGEIDVARTALIAKPIQVGPGPNGSARLILDNPGELRIKTDAPTPQLLVVSESYHAGWVASTTTSECVLVRVYADLMGCRLEAGQHEVELRFEPPSYRLGLWCSGAGLVLGGLAWVVAMGRFRRRPTQSTPHTQ